MSNKKTILFINDWGTNPNERIFYIADYFKRHGKYKTLIFGRKYHNVPQRNDLLIIKSPFLNLDRYPDSRTVRYLIRIILIIWGIYLLIKQKPKYVYIRSVYLSFIFGYLNRVFRFKLIYETHGFAYKEAIFKKGDTFKSWFLKHMEEGIIKRLCYAIVTNTNGLEENIKKAHRFYKNIYIITNGIDLDNFHNIDKIKWEDKPKGFIAGFIGNWERWINIEELLEVSKLDLDNAISVVVIGQGKCFEIYKKKYTKVYYTGKISREQAMSYLLEFDVCVSPWSSDPIFKEKSARKTYEYLAAGKPIIVSDVPGKEEFLITNENCLVYESGNPASLYSTIAKLKENHDLRINIGKNNTILSRDYSWEKVIKRSRISELF